MRRVAAVSLVAAAGAVVLACTTFAFQAPDAGATDAAPDRQGDLDAGPPSTQLLSVPQAALFCAQLFHCPQLDEATELSMALPVATPLGYSACMDWVAGPIDPARPGLSSQQSLLQAVAEAGTCTTAYDALPVRPSAEATCVNACPDAGVLQTCAHDAGVFVLPCAPPYFGQDGTCYADDAGLAQCLSGGTAGACTTGSSCTSASTLASCLSAKAGAYSSYDCLLSGRTCMTLGTHLADCVAPGHNTAPCPVQTDSVRDACDGTSVLHCAGTLSAQTEIACGAVDRTCSQSNPAGVARCVGAADQCTPFDLDVDQCSDGGSAIRLCIGGVKQSFDCASEKMQCVPASSTQTAHCG